MYSSIVKRVGWILLAVGAIDLAVTVARISVAGPWPGIADVTAIVAGALVPRCGSRGALWFRSLVVMLLAAGVMLILAALATQPPDLTLTEIRLDPLGFAAKAVPLAIGLGVLWWVQRELARAPVQDAIASAGIRRWDMMIPAQAGGGLVLLATLMLWLALHGQSRQLAESLALQQLGPGYRYHLSWISSSGRGHGTSVSGVVTAWNDKEIKRVLLHWETP